MRRFLTGAVSVFVLSSNLLGQEPPRVDRYWGEFEIARVQLTAEPFDGGAGDGLKTSWKPIFAQAVVRVEEAQNFTWEWLGLTAPGEMALEGFPNLMFEGVSEDTVEFQELTMRFGISSMDLRLRVRPHGMRNPEKPTLAPEIPTMTGS